MTLVRPLRRRLFGVSPRDAEFEKRGFWGGKPSAQDALEQVGKTFITGYLHALDESDSPRLTDHLESIDPAYRGFAYEGAAMGLAILDLVAPWTRSRFQSYFMDGPGSPHIYMAHVGYGWAAAKLPVRVARKAAKLDPLLNWLALDGYGFHEGYYHTRRTVEEQRLPRGISGYAARAFDQGLGRSLWFVSSADVERASQLVLSFADQRRADLWAGIALACTYAGQASAEEIDFLIRKAGTYRFHCAQGAAFAAEARQLAGNSLPHTELACRRFCGLSAPEAAAVTVECRPSHLADTPAGPAYETWRSRIRKKLERNQQAYGVAS